VPGDDNVSLTISGLEIFGANNDPSLALPGGPSNGAGILFEMGNGSLTVVNSRIHGNEDGILTGGARRREHQRHVRDRPQLRDRQQRCAPVRPDVWFRP
jgi:hypothetical protein